MKALLSVCALCLLTAGCAKSPEEIAAADIGSGVYRNSNCTQIAELTLQYTQRLEALSAEQSSARTGDTVGVLLLGLPLSSMSGNDRETDIAVTRGHLNELAIARQARNCPTT